MALTDTEPSQTADDSTPSPTWRSSTTWLILGVAFLLLLALAWQFLLHPTITAPTRDPAWYTWRGNVILESSPGSVAREWGPGSVFSGGYRVTAPLAAAMLQRVAGIDQYSFSAFLMIGIPVLTGLALGAAGYRSRRDPLLVLLSMLVAAALFLTTPYVGYLDNTMMLFLLCAILPFLGPSRTSWGARSAVFLLSIAAAFTHPTTCVIYGVVLMAVFGWHFLTSRFSLGSALPLGRPDAHGVGVRDDRRPGHVGRGHLGSGRQALGRRAPAARTRRSSSSHGWVSGSGRSSRSSSAP